MRATQIFVGEKPCRSDQNRRSKPFFIGRVAREISREVKRVGRESRLSSEPFVRKLNDGLPESAPSSTALPTPCLDGRWSRRIQGAENALMADKAGLQGKLSDFDRTGERWLELTRNWIITGNKAEKLAAGENYASMRDFLRELGSNPKIQNSLLAFTLKNPFDYLYDLRTQNRGVAAAIVENSGNVDRTGFEPVTSSLQMRRSTN